MFPRSPNRALKRHLFGLVFVSILILWLILGIATPTFAIIEEEPPALSQPPPAPPPQSTNVNIQNFAFNPDTLTVSVGTTLTWTNLDSAPHTVTSDDNLFDSGNLNQNATFSRTFTTPGTYAYHCSIHPFMTAKIVVQGVQPPPPPPAPPPAGQTSLRDFDTNNNDLIDDGEFFAIIDAWVAGQIDNATFFQGVDLWVSQMPISSAGLADKPLRLDHITLAMNPMRHTVIFSASGQGIASMHVDVFTLSGERVFIQETGGSRLAWDLRTPQGRPVANGVYLYVVTVFGIDGELIQSRPRKLFVLR